MIPPSNPPAKVEVLQNLPAFKETELGHLAGWMDLLIDAGLDLYLIGRPSGTVITCCSAMAVEGRLTLCCDEYPAELNAAVEAIKVRLGEATSKVCQLCGKPATLSQNKQGWLQVRCPACFRAAANRP